MRIHLFYPCPVSQLLDSDPLIHSFRDTSYILTLTATEHWNFNIYDFIGHFLHC